MRYNYVIKKIVSLFFLPMTAISLFYRDRRLLSLPVEEFFVYVLTIFSVFAILFTEIPLLAVSDVTGGHIAFLRHEVSSL